MSTGTGVTPSTDRCRDCGHLLEDDCGCSCTGPGCCYPTEEARDGAAEARAGAMDPDALGDPDSRCSDPYCDGYAGHPGQHYQWVPE